MNIYLAIIIIAVSSFSIGLIVGLAVNMRYSKIKAKHIHNSKYLF